ncbi:MAG: type VI secretion system-associated FHA domain protein TagH [Acetobacter aceti]|nr:type VI secretion system-associated FHA domain protein TagH [Acetobacter aceti]
MTTLTLKVITTPGGARGENRTVTGRKFTIGRDPACDLCLSDASRVLSKKHCSIERHGDRWDLVDTSTNGTFINQDTTPLRKASRELRNRDSIEIGGYRFEVLIGDDEPLSPSAAPVSRNLPSSRYEDDRSIGSAFLSPEPEGSDGVADMGEVDPFLSQDVSINVLPKADDTPVMHDPGLLHMPCVPPRVVSEQIGDDWDQDPELGAGHEEPLAPLSGPAETGHSSLHDNPFAGEEDLSDLLPEENGHSVAAPRVDMTSRHDSEEDLIASLSHEPASPGLPPQPEVQPVPHQNDERNGSQEAADDLLGAFLYGAGLKGGDLRDFTSDTMEELGRTFRAMIHGLRQIMIARATIKGEFRIEQTMIQASGNNPLKFSANDDDALLALIGIGRNSGMLPSDAIGEALNDMRTHEFAVLRAMQDAIGALLARVDPARFREDAGSRFLDFCPDNNNGRAFRQYEEHHRRTVAALSDDFDSAFGKAFARSYEKAIMKADDALQKSDMRGRKSAYDGERS